MSWLKFVVPFLVHSFFSYISLNIRITLAFGIEFFAAQQWLTCSETGKVTGLKSADLFNNFLNTRVCGQ